MAILTMVPVMAGTGPSGSLQGTAGRSGAGRGGRCGPVARYPHGALDRCSGRIRGHEFMDRLVGQWPLVRRRSWPSTGRGSAGRTSWLPPLMPAGAWASGHRWPKSPGENFWPAAASGRQPPRPPRCLDRSVEREAQVRRVRVAAAVHAAHLQDQRPGRARRRKVDPDPVRAGGDLRHRHGVGRVPRLVDAEPGG
jgi:hypothetical protein